MDPNLKKLCKLVDFGFDCMKAANIPSLRRLRGAKQHLFMFTAVSHNYSESICVLCKQTRTQAASVLLRPLCECLIKARYLYCNPRLHLWELRLEAWTEKRKQLNGMKDHLKSSKLVEVRFVDTVSVNDIRTSLGYTLSQIEYCERFFRNHGGEFKKGKPSLKGILGKAKYVDEHNSDKQLRSESLEYFYHLVYRNLSSSVHLDGRNFPDFLDWDEEGCEVLLSGDVKRVPDVAGLALWLYQNLMRQFFLVYRIPRVREMNVILADS